MFILLYDAKSHKETVTDHNACAALSTSLLLLSHTPLPGNIYYLETTSGCSAIGWCHNVPLPQVSDCQWVAISGSAVSQLSVEWWSPGRQRVRWETDPSLLPGALQLTRLLDGGAGRGLCPVGLRSHRQGPLPARPRFCGDGEPLPHPCLCNLRAATSLSGSPSAGPGPHHVGGLRSPGPLGSSAPGFLSNDNWPWGSHQLRSAP